MRYLQSNNTNQSHKIKTDYKEITLSSSISSMCGVRLIHMKPVPKSSISVYINLVVVDSKAVGQHLQQNLHPSLPKQHSSCEFRYTNQLNFSKTKTGVKHTCELQHPCLAMTYFLHSGESPSETQSILHELQAENDE